MKMSLRRNRPFQSLNECVNPEYMRGGTNVTVKDSIDFCIYDIYREALRRRNKGYEIVIFLPNYIGKRSIMQHIFIGLSEKVGPIGIKLEIGEECDYPHLQVDFVSMSRVHPKCSIPVSWNDDLTDWTWKDVVNHGEYYSSSSSEVWPPPHYQMRAQAYKTF